LVKKSVFRKFEDEGSDFRLHIYAMKCAQGVWEHIQTGPEHFHPVEMDEIGFACNFSPKKWQKN
jgi:hypothetical protein